MVLYIDFLEPLDNEDLLMHNIVNIIAKHPNYAAWSYSCMASY
jgi:hypothetical protein